MFFPTTTKLRAHDYQRPGTIIEKLQPITQVEIEALHNLKAHLETLRDAPTTIGGEIYAKPATMVEELFQAITRADWKWQRQSRS